MERNSSKENDLNWNQKKTIKICIQAKSFTKHGDAGKVSVVDAARTINLSQNFYIVLQAHTSFA